MGPFDRAMQEQAAMQDRYEMELRLLRQQLEAARGEAVGGEGSHAVRGGPSGGPSVAPPKPPLSTAGSMASLRSGEF